MNMKWLCDLFSDTGFNTLTTWINTLVSLGVLVFIQKLRKTWKRDKNPYTPWTPVTPPNFVGRRKLLKQLEASSERYESISLIGDRRIGKTSVLETWEKKLKEQGKSVFLLNGQRDEGATVSAFVTEITGKLASENPDEAAGALSGWANEVKVRMNFTPIVMVDDAEHIIRNFPSRFFERLRGMMQERRVIWIFSLREHIDLIYKNTHNNTSPFDNLLHIQQVGLLETEAAEEIIKWGGFKGEKAKLMRVWAGRHPFYLQLLGRHLSDERNQRAALDAFQTESARRLAELWDKISPKEQEMLKQYMAGKPADRPGLRTRGLLTEDNKIFGKVLEEWLKDN
ncbi:MAG: hypothetical protein BWK80_13780 [Desulfobacteraceae bacterium IS3]|nr:MAG: hypothetical protein BWK80_13780 [Desulfobacteraceae bacterium IS3]